MTRCNSCNGIVTKTDSECFTCGEPVPGAAKRSRRAKQTSAAKSAAPPMPIRNVVFIALLVAALVLMAVCFVTNVKVPLPVSAGLSGVLFTTKIVTDRRASKRIPVH
jgi:uncharacterized membrane protein YvbJ